VRLAAGSILEGDPRVVAVGFTGERGDYTLGLDAEVAFQQLGIDAFALLDRSESDGSAGDTVVHQVLPGQPPGTIETLILVGIGATRPQDYRRAGASIARLTRGRGPVATTLGAQADDDQLAALVEGLMLGCFSFSRKSAVDQPAGPASVRLANVRGKQRQQVVDHALIRAAASWRARSYALTPSNEKGPERLEAWAQAAAGVGGLTFDSWDEKRLAADGFGGIVAVGRGSAYESRLVRLDYRPGRRRGNGRHVVLVGKGITFDSGGLSIKPRTSMENMKRDMTGAAVVIAVMGALGDLGIRSRVTGLIACAENAVGAASMRPGDVVTHFGGRTTEVGNTDAEGRLVLADALAYADARLDPDVVVDVATLTGAAKMALGTSLAAMFATDDELAVELSRAGDVAGEPVWRLPLSAEYESTLDNPVADSTNMAGAPGAVTAALFLKHFAGERRWAHLDIASVGDSPVDAYEYTSGATGFGARLLLRWLQDA
jgi:leucyl aminopeptidase